MASRKKWSAVEKQALIEIVKRRKAVLLDATRPNAKAKTVAWDEIFAEMKQRFGDKFEHGDARKIQTKWQRIKQRAQAELNEYKRSALAKRVSKQCREVCDILEVDVGALERERSNLARTSKRKSSTPPNATIKREKSACSSELDIFASPVPMVEQRVAEESPIALEPEPAHVREPISSLEREVQNVVKIVADTAEINKMVAVFNLAELVKSRKDGSMFSGQLGDLGSGAGQGGGGGGSIREAGGAFGKMEAAREEEYFYKQQKKQLEDLKSGLTKEITFHEEQIKRHQEAIERHKLRVKEMDDHK